MWLHASQWGPTSDAASFSNWISSFAIFASESSQALCQIVARSGILSELVNHLPNLVIQFQMLNILRDVINSSQKVKGIAYG
jgi:hypothetical protein